VDDEGPARALLREYLAAHAGVSVVAECDNGFDAVRVLSQARPDLVLLDVQMPKLDGFEVLELLEQPPVVVFVTAYDEHALRAFEVNAVDYVLKPVGRDRLDKALARARERLGEAQAHPSPRALARAARPPGTPLQRVIVKGRRRRAHVIPVSHRLDRARTTWPSTCGGRTHLKNEPLQELEKALDPARFVRIHRSTSLNVGAAHAWSSWGRTPAWPSWPGGETLP
jgi:two-component system LytT family response regulator